MTAIKLICCQASCKRTRQQQMWRIFGVLKCNISFPLFCVFLAWEGPHHPRNLLLGVVYAAKVSQYELEVTQYSSCGLRVTISRAHAEILFSVGLDVTFYGRLQNGCLVAWKFFIFALTSRKVVDVLKKKRSFLEGSRKSTPSIFVYTL